MDKANFFVYLRPNSGLKLCARAIHACIEAGPRDKTTNASIRMNATLLIGVAMFT